MVQTNALGIGVDTGPSPMPVQYERIARAAGNAIIPPSKNLFPHIHLINTNFTPC